MVLFLVWAKAEIQIYLNFRFVFDLGCKRRKEKKRRRAGQASRPARPSQPPFPLSLPSLRPSFPRAHRPRPNRPSSTHPFPISLCPVGPALPAPSSSPLSPCRWTERRHRLCAWPAHTFLSASPWPWARTVDPLRSLSSPMTSSRRGSSPGQNPAPNRADAAKTSIRTRIVCAAAL